MNYIVLDLEWNQPLSFQSDIYRKMGDVLLFEIIQFGAVKMDENLNIVGSISIPVNPSFYQKIHPRIKKITGLTQEILCDADPFPEALEKFIEWCGKDTVFITWGGDDISVLAQNIECFHLSVETPPMYDLQKYYGKVMGKGGQTSLKSALDTLEIAEEEDKSFHNAMHDAYYTGLVFEKLGNPEKIMGFPERVKKLHHSEKRVQIRVAHEYPSVAEALTGEALSSPHCPSCRRSMVLQTGIIPQAKGRYIALAKCPVHGLMFMKIHLMRLPEGDVGMSLNIKPAGSQIKAYVRTKEYQYQFKQKRGDFVGVDPEDLGDGFNPDLPFDDRGQ